MTTLADRIMARIPEGYKTFSPYSVDRVLVHGPGKPTLEVNIYTGAMRELEEQPLERPHLNPNRSEGEAGG